MIKEHINDGNQQVWVDPPQTQTPCVYIFIYLQTDTCITMKLVKALFGGYEMIYLKTHYNIPIHIEL